MLPFRSCAVAAASLLLLATLSAPSAAARIDDDFSGYGPATVVDDGGRVGPWRVVFDGDHKRASVRVLRRVLRLVPQPAQSADQTYAALVVSRERFGVAPLHVEASWVTRQTTRMGVPNPWEVGWLVWDYVDNDHFTYLVLKPNGWEVGRRDPSMPGGQRFLYGDVAPVTPVGQLRTVTVDRVGQVTTIRVDGTELVSYPLPARERRGAVGMYTEDAMVDWLSFTAVKVLHE